MRRDGRRNCGHHHGADHGKHGLHPAPDGYLPKSCDLAHNTGAVILMKLVKDFATPGGGQQITDLKPDSAPSAALGAGFPSAQCGPRMILDSMRLGTADGAALRNLHRPRPRCASSQTIRLLGLMTNAALHALTGRRRSEKAPACPPRYFSSQGKIQAIRAGLGPMCQIYFTGSRCESTNDRDYCQYVTPRNIRVSSWISYAESI